MTFFFSVCIGSGPTVSTESSALSHGGPRLPGTFGHHRRRLRLGLESRRALQVGTIVAVFEVRSNVF